MIKITVPPFQKQPFTDVFESRCSKKLCNIHRSICMLRKVFQGFKEQQWHYYTFPSKQVHAQNQQWKS